MALTCPVTGLNVISRPEWTNRKVSDTLSVTYYLVGNAILYSATEGHADLSGVQRAYDLKKEVLNHPSMRQKNYIQIQDYFGLNSSTTTARRYFTKNAINDKRLLSIVWCNLSLQLSLVVNIGRRFNTTGKNTYIVPNYEDAINKASELCIGMNIELDYLLTNSDTSFGNIECSLVPVDLIVNDNWNIYSPTYNNRSVIVDNCILHAIPDGYLEPVHIPLHERAIPMFEEALPEGCNIQYLLVDGSKIKAQFSARISFIKLLKRWHQEFPKQMYIIYGANRYMHTAVYMSNPLLPFKITIANDLEHGFKLIGGSRQGYLSDHDLETDTPDPNLVSLLDFIGNIDWSREGIESSIDIDSHHEYYMLFQSIRLIKDELDGLFLERDKTEESLKHANAKFEIAYSKLAQTQAEMVRQERLAAIGELAAGIAHDFNNIICVIMGTAELMQRSPDTPDAILPRVKQIAKSSKRAERLVGQLLDFTRKTHSNPVDIDLIAFANDSVKFIERTIPENIRIALTYEPGNYYANVDPIQLQQVIANLALNSRDAMPEGGDITMELSHVELSGNIHCALCDRVIDGSWMQIRIVDTGDGISADGLHRIFEPFYTTKDVGKGTGLGLSQVSGIVAQNGGHMLVKSRIGQGTTFSVLLPVAQSSGEEHPSHRPIQLNHEPGATVLLVEDDETVLEVVTAMLQELGYWTITAGNGIEAMTIYEERKSEIALILSDMMMPDMNGEALFNALRADNPNLNMAIISGYPIGERGTMLLEQGLVGWIKKPISLESLGEVVDKALTNRSV